MLTTRKGDNSMIYLFDRLWKRLEWKIRRWVVRAVCQYVVVGAHCGLCGAWIEGELADKYWAWSVCEKCGGHPTYAKKDSLKVVKVEMYAKREEVNHGKSNKVV